MLPETIKPVRELLVRRPPNIRGVEVLYRSFTLQGESLPRWIFSNLQDPEVAAIVLSGESGAAKTTETGQIAKQADKLSDGRAKVTAFSSGVELNRIGQELTDSMRQGIDFEGNPITPLGPNEDFDRTQYTPAIWSWAANRLAGRLSGVIERALEENHKDPSNLSLVVADIAGIGRKNPRLAAGLGQVTQAFLDNALFGVVPANPDIQGKALTLRLKAEALLKALLQTRCRQGLTTDNIGRIGKLKPAERRIIKATLAEEAVAIDVDLVPGLLAIYEGTRPGRFEEVRDEYIAEVLEWARGTKSLKGALGPVEGRLRNLQMQNLFAIYDENRAGLYALKLAHADDYLHIDLGIPEDSDHGRVLLVPYLREIIHQWRSLLS